MSASPGDQARVSVRVGVQPKEAFRIFTEEIDLWWRTGLKYFAPAETTEVEVLFEPTASGTLVTVTHRGWSRIRPDHPVRHGEDVIAFVRTMGLWWGDLMSSMREHAGRTLP